MTLRKPSVLDMILRVIENGDYLDDITQKIITYYPLNIKERLDSHEDEYPQIRGIVAAQLMRSEDTHFYVDREGSVYSYYTIHRDPGKVEGLFTVEPDQSAQELKENIIDQEMWAIIHDLEELEIIQNRIINRRVRIRDVKMSMEV